MSREVKTCRNCGELMSAETWQKGVSEWSGRITDDSTNKCFVCGHRLAKTGFICETCDNEHTFKKDADKCCKAL